MDIMAKQHSVFTKEHMDRILAEDRRVDATGKLGQCSLRSLLTESGALDDKGSHFGPLAQAAASYYVRQRTDDINERTAWLRQTKGHQGFYTGSALGRLAFEIVEIDEDLSKRCPTYTMVIDNGTAALMIQTGQFDFYDNFDVSTQCSRFPESTRRFAGMDLGHPLQPMPNIVFDALNAGKSYDLYSKTEKLAVQDRFCSQLSGALHNDKNAMQLFNEVYMATVVASAASVNGKPFIPEGASCEKCLFGNSICAQLDMMDYFTYAKERSMSKQAGVATQNYREIKNVPDFIKSDSPSVQSGMDYDF